MGREPRLTSANSFTGASCADLRSESVEVMCIRYTLDAATEFLLGRSANSLGNADSDFALAFDEVQRIQTIRVRSGPFQHFVPLWTFRRGLKVMASFIEPFVQEALCKDAGELGEKEGKESTWLDSVARFTRDRTGDARGRLCQTVR